MDVEKLSVDHNDIDVNTGRIILPSVEYLEQINSHAKKSELQREAVLPAPTSFHTPDQEPSVIEAGQSCLTDHANVHVANSDDLVSSPRAAAVTSPSPKGWLLTPMMLTGLFVCFFALLLGTLWLFLMNENIHSIKDSKLIELSEQRDALLFESLVKEHSILKADLAALKQGVDKLDELQRKGAVEATALFKAVESLESAVFIYEDEYGNLLSADEVTEQYIIEE